MTPRLTTGLWVAKPTATLNTELRSLPDQVRAEHLLSVAEVARRAGVNRSAVSLILGRSLQHGNVRGCRLETASKITRALPGEYRVEDLFDLVPADPEVWSNLDRYVLLVRTLAGMPRQMEGQVQDLVWDLVRLLCTLSPEELFHGQERLRAAMAAQKVGLE